MQQQVNPGVDATKLRWRLSDQVVVLLLLPCVRKTLWHNNDTKQQRNNQMRYVSFGSTVLQPKRGKAETTSSDINNERCQRQRQRVATITTTPYSTIHSSFRLCPTASGDNDMRQDSKRQQRQATTMTCDNATTRQSTTRCRRTKLSTTPMQQSTTRCHRTKHSATPPTTRADDNNDNSTRQSTPSFSRPHETTLCRGNDTKRNNELLVSAE